MPLCPLDIKEKSYLTDTPPSDMPTNSETLSAKTATLSIQHTCHVETAAPATYMPADLVLLSPTLLLFKHAYWLSAAARWMLAGLLLAGLNQHAC